MGRTSLFIIPAVISMMFFSCLKSKGTINPINGSSNSLEGNWMIVNDSTTITPWGLWAGAKPTGTNYIGKPSDYFDFKANTVTYSENGNTYTATYALKQNYLYIGFNIQNRKDTALYTIISLTAHTATLGGDTSVSPEQVFSHVINLKR